MPITILAPVPAVDYTASAVESAEYGRELASKLRGQGVVTPGETITEDAQWMRGHGTQLEPGTTRIQSTVAGRLSKTNKLLTVTATRARYAPEIGDLVIGRIIEVQARRWRVELNAAQPGSLPLASVNLPGGALRRRTAVDELALRNYFAEGDLVLAEVRAVFADGAAELHTRSLRYGKLRSGLCVVLKGAGGLGAALARSAATAAAAAAAASSARKTPRANHADSQGLAAAGVASVAGVATGRVARSRRQIFTLAGANGARDIDVALGVNGYIWISQHSAARSGSNVSGGGLQGGHDVDGAEGGLDDGYGAFARLEEGASADIYSSQNDDVSLQTRLEISRVANCVLALAAAGGLVDQDSVVKEYQESVEMDAFNSGS